VPAMLHVRYHDGTTAFLCIKHLESVSDVGDWHEVGTECGPKSRWIASRSVLDEGHCSITP
jgi:hypothetical protein